MSSSLVSQAASSALPYYHTLYSKPQGAKKVHATTFVPEVGVFKGPSVKLMGKATTASTTLVVTSSTASSWHASSDFPLRAEPRPLSVAVSPRPSDGTPSPSLLSPGREVGSLLTSPSHRMPSPGVSPSVSHISVETPLNIETASSVDSASICSHSGPSGRSHSVASAHSGLELNDSDDTSGNEENTLVIDDDDSTEEANDTSNSKPAALTSRHEKLFRSDLTSSRGGAEDNESHRGSGCHTQHDTSSRLSSTISLPRKVSPSPKMRHKKCFAPTYFQTEPAESSLSNYSCKKINPALGVTERNGASSSPRKIGSHGLPLSRMRHAATSTDLKKNVTDQKMLVSRRALPQAKGDARIVKVTVSDPDVSRCISAPPSGVDSPSHMLHKAVVSHHVGSLKEDKPENSTEQTGGK